MTKISWKPGTMVYPLPPALISSGSLEKPNVMTAAWTGIINSEPPMTYVSIRPTRLSYEIISQTKEFVINLPTVNMVTAVDFCGVKSGRDVNKFEETGLTPIASSNISAPQILQCPVSVECKVVDIKKLGSHDMFMAEIVSVDVDDNFIDADGKFWLEKTGLLAFAHGHYFSLGRNLGSFGFSVNKKRLALMQKMEKVDVMVKERKAIILEKRAEAEERPLTHKSKFAKHKKTAISAPHAQKFDGKAKFKKHFSPNGQAPAENFYKPKKHSFKPKKA